MFAPTGLSVLPSLAWFVTNRTVDLAGLLVPPKLTMIVAAFKLEMRLLFFRLRILSPVALDLNVDFLWVAMVVNPLVLGSFSPLKV
jgi:hypothetical protein